jgi:hypothetical protein
MEVIKFLNEYPVRVFHPVVLSDQLNQNLQEWLPVNLS